MELCHPQLQGAEPAPRTMERKAPSPQIAVMQQRQAPHQLRSDGRIVAGVDTCSVVPPAAPIGRKRTYGQARGLTCEVLLHVG